MDFIDDDFGDLYVDVEVQASSAVDGGVGFGKVSNESKCNTDCDRNVDTEATIDARPKAGEKKLGLVTQKSSRCVENRGVTTTAASYEPEASDRDDDLNIVRNDGDAEVFPGTCGSDCKDGGGGDSAASGPATVVNGVGALQNDSLLYRKADNSCIMPYDSGGAKIGSSTDDTIANEAPAIPQCGCSFSLLWYRKLFNTNVDSFEEKPWRNPGADITDFFNFGFSEKSWKEYCKSLRKHYASHCEHVKAVEDGVKEKTQFESPSSSADGVLRPLMLPKGRAIQVEDGIIERIPSVELRRHRDPDPGVVIQVPMDDAVREQSALTSEEMVRPNIGSNETSGNEDLHLDNRKRSHSSIDSTEELASEEFQEGKIRTSISEQYHPKENCCSPQGIPCAKEVIDEEEKEVCRELDRSHPDSVERELSYRDRIHFSPTPSSSYSIGKTEQSEDTESESWQDGASDDRFEVHIPPQRTRIEESDCVEYRICEGDSVRRLERNERKRSRHRKTSHQEPRKSHFGRLNSPVYRGMKHERYIDGSSMSNSHVGEEICARRKRSHCNSSKYQYRKPLFALRRDENDGKGFPTSDTERHYKRLNVSENHIRYSERQHRSGYQHAEGSRSYKVMECSNGYTNERVLEKHTVSSPFDYSHRKSRWSFKEQEDCYGRRHYERSYFQERSAIQDNENIRDRNRYDSQGGPKFEDKAPLIDRQSGWCSLDYYADCRRRNCTWHEENDLQYRNRGESELWSEKYGVPFELADRGKHYFVEPRRRGFPVYERELEFSGRAARYDYNPNWHFGRFSSKKTDFFEQRTADARPLSSFSFRESWSAKRAKLDFWTDDIRDFSVNEAFDRQNQISKARGRYDWIETPNDTVDMEANLANESDWVCPERRRCNLKDGLQDSKSSVMHREQPLFTDKILRCYRRNSTCDWLSSRQRSRHNKDHVYERDHQHHRFKKMREDYDVSVFRRNEHEHEHEHEHAFLKCQDPPDLTARKGELGRRASRSKGNGRGEKTRTGSANPPERIIQRTLSSRGNEKSADKFLVNATPQDLDFEEEGEIVEEPSSMKKKKKKKRASCAGDVKRFEINEERIIESLKKMEKRRARFNESITPTKDSKTAATFEPQAEPTGKTKGQRPTRKRRWVAD